MDRDRAECIFEARDVQNLPMCVHGSLGERECLQLTLELGLKG